MFRLQPGFRNRKLVGEPGATLSQRSQWVSGSKQTAMAGACGSLRKASAMNCQVVTTTVKPRSYVSSLLPDHPGSDRTLSATAESGFKTKSPTWLTTVTMSKP